jgi:hypothetical protein
MFARRGSIIFAKILAALIMRPESPTLAGLQMALLVLLAEQKSLQFLQEFD